VKELLLNAPGPPKELPFGRTLAQSLAACANFEPPPAGPVKPVPPRRNGGVPPLAGRPPVGKLRETPCFFRQAAKAVVDAFVEDEPVELLEADLVLEVELVVELPPPQAAMVKATVTTASAAKAARSRRGFPSAGAIECVGTELLRAGP
jgi:hypothetical protein